MVGGWFDWLADPWQATMQKYERAKAELMAWLGRFAGLRAQLLDMRDQAQAVETAAERRGDPALREAARSLRGEIDAAYDRQLELEQQVLKAREKIGAVEQGKRETSESGVGLLPLAIVAAALAVIAATIGAIVIHTQRVNYLRRVLDELTRKTLTAREAAALTGQGFGASIGSALGWGAAIIGGILAWRAFGKRSRARR